MSLGSGFVIPSKETGWDGGGPAMLVRRLEAETEGGAAPAVSRWWIRSIQYACMYTTWVKSNLVMIMTIIIMIMIIRLVRFKVNLVTSQKVRRRSGQDS
jgi:hypothetical protein